MLNALNVPIVSGSTPSSFPMKLQSQQIPIQGVVVDNGNSTVDVWVYQGNSPSGNPFIVKAGWSRGFSVNGTSAIYIVFAGVPTANGSVYICASSEPQSAFSTQEATVTVTGPVTVNGTVAATQSGAWATTVNGTVATTQSGSWNNGKISDLPNGATPVFFSTDCAFSSGTTTVGIGTILLPGSQSFYLTQLGVWGFKRTPLWWQLQWQQATSTFETVMTASEDGFFPFFPPIVLAQGSVIHPLIRVQVYGTIVGTLNAEVFVNGYYV